MNKHYLKIIGITGFAVAATSIATFTALGVHGNPAGALTSTCLYKPGQSASIHPFGCPSSAAGSSAAAKAEDGYDPSGSQFTAGPPTINAVTSNFSQPTSGANGSFTTEVTLVNGSTTYRVFGGERGSDSSQGVVLVQTISNGSTIDANWYDSPSASGALTITGTTGDTISMTSLGGDQFNFDVSTGDFG